LFKKSVLFILDEIPMFITKIIYKIFRIEQDSILLNIYDSIQFFMWIAIYGYIAFKFNLFSNFLLFIFLFTSIRDRFENLQNEANVSYKVIHSTVLGCFSLSFLYVLNFLIFAHTFNNLFLEIIFSIIIALNTIEFYNINTNSPNGLLGRKNKYSQIESKIIKYYILKQKNDFAGILESIFDMYPTYKNICEMYYKKKYPLNLIATKLGYSYDGIVNKKNNMLKILDRYSN